MNSPTHFKGKLEAMIVSFVFGVGSLIAWSSTMSIADYYYTLFPRYHPSRTLTVVYQVCAIGTLIILKFYESKIDPRIRVTSGYCVFFLSISLVLALDLATSGGGGLGTYIGMCALCGTFGVADALVQGGMVGEMSIMCPEFIQSFLAGLAASGSLTSGIRLVTMLVFENSDDRDGLRKGAILFLAMSLVFIAACIILYQFYFPRLPIIRHYRSKGALERGTIGEVGHDDSEERLSNKQLLLQNFDYAVDLFLIYIVTLSVFPGLVFETTKPHSLGKWYPIVLISLYNVNDLVSRYLPLIKFLKLESRKVIFVVVISRFILIPAFYFTSKQGWMILMVSVLGLTNGFLTVCVLTVAPRGYKGPEQNSLGNLLVLFLTCGILGGVALDFVWLLFK